MCKAKYIGKSYTIEGYPVLHYEYRNSNYEVIDYGWHGGEQLAWQHKNEQSRIDEMIIRKENQSKMPSESCGFDIDEIFDLLEWND